MSSFEKPDEKPKRAASLPKDQEELDRRRKAAWRAAILEGAPEMEEIQGRPGPAARRPY